MFFSEELKAAIGEADPRQGVRRSLPDKFGQLDTVAKAQYLEMIIFLSNYLLSSQGDRVAMAHSVEIRLPFLDYRVIDLAARIPSRWKILGLNEKHILKKTLASVLPAEIAARRKQPYRPNITTACWCGRPQRCDRALDVGPSPTPCSISPMVIDFGKDQVVERPGENDSMALAASCPPESSGISSWRIYLEGKGEPIRPDLVWTGGPRRTRMRKNGITSVGLGFPMTGDQE